MDSNIIRNLIEEVGDLSKLKKSTLISLVKKILKESDKFTTESNNEVEISDLKDKIKHQRDLQDMVEKKYQSTISSLQNEIEDSKTNMGYLISGFCVIEIITILSFILL